MYVQAKGRPGRRKEGQVTNGFGGQRPGRESRKRFRLSLASYVDTGGCLEKRSEPFLLERRTTGWLLTAHVCVCGLLLSASTTLNSESRPSRHARGPSNPFLKLGGERESLALTGAREKRSLSWLWLCVCSKLGQDLSAFLPRPCERWRNELRQLVPSEISATIPDSAGL